MANIRHSDTLTLEEHGHVPLHGEFKKRIYSLQQQKRGLRILDWGCGRGSDVLHLREQGIEAFGAEPDPMTIERGRELFVARGLDHASLIRRIQSDNSTDFEAASFDLIMSYQVLEHVADLRGAALEMERLMRPGAVSVHLFPSHLRPVEGHLKMPLVHWLPKNSTRHAAITVFTALGIEPDWPSTTGKSVNLRARRYFQYSCDATYYRPPGEVLAVFRNSGLSAAFESRFHDRIRDSWLDRLVPAWLLEWLLDHFAGSVLICRKSGSIL